MSTITRFFIVKKDTEDWEYLHKKNTSFISVTSLITFYGYGYNSRNNLLFPRASINSSYLQKCFDHGNKYESKAIEFMENHTRLDIFKVDSLSCSRGALVGTPDAYYSTEEGKMGIMEIKCPFGTKYGRFDKEDIFIGYDNKKFKHWFQTQLYLYLHNTNEFQYSSEIKSKDIPLFEEGKLVYYYPHANDGNPLSLVFTFPYIGNEVMEKEFKIHEILLEYFFLFKEKGYKLKTKIPSYLTYPTKIARIELLQE